MNVVVGDLVWLYTSHDKYLSKVTFVNHNRIQVHNVHIAFSPVTGDALPPLTNHRITVLTKQDKLKHLLGTLE